MKVEQLISESNIDVIFQKITVLRTDIFNLPSAKERGVVIEHLSALVQELKSYLTLDQSFYFHIRKDSSNACYNIDTLIQQLPSSIALSSDIDALDTSSRVNSASFDNHTIDSLHSHALDSLLVTDGSMIDVDDDDSRLSTDLDESSHLGLSRRLRRKARYPVKLEWSVEDLVLKSTACRSEEDETATPLQEAEHWPNETRLEKIVDVANKDILCNTDDQDNDENVDADADDQEFAIENERKQYTCSLCKERLRDWSDFLVHLHRHGDAQVCCRLCYGVFNNEAIFKHHECCNPTVSVYLSRWCGFCEMHFSAKKCFDRHKRAVHSLLDRAKRQSRQVVAQAQSPTKFNCTQCGELFDTKQLMFEHSVSHFPGKSVCVLCGKLFESSHKLQAHLKAIHQRALRACTKCAEVFALREQLREHQIASHSIQCEQCQQVVGSVAALRKHFRLAHNDKASDATATNADDGTAAPPYTCAICGRHFNQRHVLAIHTARHGTAANAHCQVCRVTFSNAQRLSRHVLTETHRRRAGDLVIQRDSTCRECGKSYLRRPALLRHMRSHQEGARLQCPRCAYTTTDRSNLSQHIARHEGMRNFTCEVCSQSFTAKRSLMEHMRFKHSAARDFACQVCGMSFKTKSTLGRHAKKHASTRSLSCNVCSMTFYRMCHLRRHMSSVHKKQLPIALNRMAPTSATTNTPPMSSVVDMDHILPAYCSLTATSDADVAAHVSQDAQHAQAIQELTALPTDDDAEAVSAAANDHTNDMNADSLLLLSSVANATEPLDLDHVNKALIFVDSMVSPISKRVAVDVAGGSSTDNIWRPMMPTTDNGTSNLALRGTTQPAAVSILSLEDILWGNPTLGSSGPITASSSAMSSNSVSLLLSECDSNATNNSTWSSYQPHFDFTNIYVPPLQSLCQSSSSASLDHQSQQQIMLNAPNNLQLQNQSLLVSNTLSDFSVGYLIGEQSHSGR